MALRIVLSIVGLSQLALGGLTLLAPGPFFTWMGLTAPPVDNGYMLAMLAARFRIDHVTLQPSWPASHPFGDRRVIPIAPADGGTPRDQPG